MFGKRPSELSKTEIERLIQEAIQEDTGIELKETLPAKGRDRDPWVSGGERIGDRARNEIIEEVIAFANAYGGSLVIGIAETKERPARASKIVPLPRCADLAERLRLQCRDCIEPQVPLLEVAGVPIKEDGSGVVVFGVPKSRMAPHRHTVTRECYIRRADRTEKMAMREIQDLTLQVERGLAAIEAKFEAQRRQFAEQVQAFVGNRKPAFGVRATLIPLVPLYIERVHNNDAVRPPLLTLSCRIDGEDPYDLFVPIYSAHWRPILRGTRTIDDGDNLSLRREAFCDGLIEYVLLVRQKNAQPPCIYPQWILGLVANAQCAAELFRRAADAPEVEYGLEFEIQVIGENLPVGKYGRDPLGDWLGPFPTGQALFPRYSVGSPDEFARTTALLERDFWNAAGHDWSHAVEIDFVAAFEELGLTSAD